MKKRFIALLVVGIVAIVVVGLIFARSQSPGIIRSETSQGTEGSFYVFYTDSTKEYLNFLEEFDEKKYEIVDISKDDGFWCVTYKVTE